MGRGEKQLFFVFTGELEPSGFVWKVEVKDHLTLALA